MAYVLWRIFFKKYSKIRLEIQRHPSILVTPIRGNGKKNSTDEAWSEAKIDDKSPYPAAAATANNINCEECNIATQCDADDIEAGGGGLRKSDTSKVEVRRNKSRVRSYLKKCKDRLTGHQPPQDDHCTDCQKYETPDYSNTTSWYMEEEKPPDINNCNPPSSVDPGGHSNLKQTEEGCSSVGNENLCTCENETPLEPVAENSVLLMDSGIEDLIDKYLADIYPLYLESTRSVLIRQARDILVCTYHGCLKAFEENFLSQTTEIVKKIRENHVTGEPYAWCKGWPLATAAGAVVLHLGTIDESIVRPQDIYLCIRPAENSNPQLCIAWRQSATSSKVHYQTIDCEKQSLSPLSVEMLTDELPQLLQNLLVGVERAIGRIPLNELSFPISDRFVDSSSGGSSGGGIGEQNYIDGNRNDKVINSPKCVLKRSDLITKNKVMNNKYLLRRLSTSKFETNSCESASSVVVVESKPVPNLPVFCLGGSFPHIDSDEENTEDRNAANADSQLPHEIVAPRSILELPEKLLASGIHLPGTRDVSGRQIITIDGGNVTEAGLNCYEVATVLLYYSTISESKSSYCIIVMLNKSTELPTVELICSSLKLLTGHFKCEEVLAVCLDKNLLNHTREHSRAVNYMHVDDISSKLSPAYTPEKLQGLHYHDQSKWREFFITIEPFQTQCLTTGHRLVSAMADIRTSDLQGLPSRRQLYAQHRALSRALMDTELHYLRKRGAATINRLQELAKNLSKSNTKCCADKELIENEDVTNRLNKVIVLFNEVDRAAKRLEQITEQRRERLRELTRQRALEDEMNEVTSWIQNDGDETLRRFTNMPLECKDTIKDHEQEFEKYYFISMKHLAKGRDLYDAAIDLEALKTNAASLKETLKNFSERLENARERIEGVARLHHLFSLDLRDEDVQVEVTKLAIKIGVPGLIEKCFNRKTTIIETTTTTTTCHNSIKPNEIINPLATSTPEKLVLTNEGLCHCWREESARVFNCGKNEQNEEDEEEHSRIADSGLGGCDRCEGNTKLSRVCSCQSFEDAGNLCDKSHNSDELEEDCFEGNSKQFLDIHSPIEPNTHLQCHASSLDLHKMEDVGGLDPKIQKKLLLIMNEMIVTERDYVRSLYYVIENYMDELLREDIPQALRGQRNVIFGNIEKIFEFHQPHFLAELEQYENNPLKVGAAFLENESKFYLYALYNKNKPKSDTLMSEYGSSFFKSKQLELNDKMDLASYLLKPVQRMGKYALLLQELVKACSSVQDPVCQEIVTDIEELQRAEEMVKFQLRHGNDLLAMDSLRDCDVNVKEQGRLLRQNEFLVWQGRGGKKSLQQIFLFEDLVLFSKARRFPDHKNLDIFIYKQSIKTSDIGLTAHIGDSPTKFEIWFRKRKPDDTWTMQSMSEDIKNAWTEEISKLLWKQAKRNREVRLAEMSSMGIGNKPCLDIRPSHNQINDRSISFQQLGKTPKLRNSVAGTSQEGKQSRRPNSIISECSMSSGTSSSSLSTGTASSSGSNCRNQSGLEHINEAAILSAPGSGKKHQRSTTLVSQLSMESGILSDISMTPDGDIHEPHWPVIRKSSNSSNSTDSKKQPTSSELNLAEQDPYINNDSVTVL